MTRVPDSTSNQKLTMAIIRERLVKQRGTVRAYRRIIATVLLAVAFFFVSGFLAGRASAEEFKPSRINETMRVRVHAFASDAALREHCANLGVFFRAQGGCTQSWPDAGECTIYVVLPKDTNDAAREQLVGHEVLHCFYGHWHAKPH